MKISGFQKMTLLDFPGRVACTVFTAGCNLRCPFCHNAALVTHIDESASFSEEEILDYLKKRKGLLDGVCITGGEPLLQNGIEDFIAKIKELGYAVKLDTNGFYPEKLISIVNNGLVDYVAVDIKNNKDKYAQTTGIGSLDISPLEKSVAFLLSGKVDFEFRTTVVAGLHTVDDIDCIGKWIKGAPRYFLQNFVDSGDLICSDMTALPREELYKMQQKAQEYVVNTEIRGI
ncbi:MAG: anaerobic ribonucleoside-triphosphate reductase activating protein [Acutalibacteraceae bacterium]|nr:anaerobic ribonucleoside-triphosphate reductase activating protein [Acutalibacteraceae bacterium]